MYMYMYIDVYVYHAYIYAYMYVNTVIYTVSHHLQICERLNRLSSEKIYVDQSCI